MQLIRQWVKWGIFSLIIGHFSPYLYGNATATTSGTASVNAITAFSVSGNPGALNINSAVAGSAPASVSDSSTSYNITVNSNETITGSLNSAMPAGTSLSVTLSPPSGATSLGKVTLTTTAQNLVTGVVSVAQSNLSITYTFSATVSAGPISSTSRIVTYTVTP